MDELRRARLRWRLRGALQWPLFGALVPLDAVLLNELPVSGDGPGGIVPGMILAGFLNLFLVAVGAPLLGRRLRRRRPDLPRPVASDYAGAALLVCAAGGLLVAGLLHRPRVLEERRDGRAALVAVHDYVLSQARGYRTQLASSSTVRLGPDFYRSCVPSPRRDGRPLCLFVETDQVPPGVRRDTEQVPNSSYR